MFLLIGFLQTENIEKCNALAGPVYPVSQHQDLKASLPAFLDQEDATRTHLVSMWTAPTHRQRGIGRLLVNEVLDWARLRSARTLG
jgi:GNAT superfamily N-acetyltransferase